MNALHSNTRKMPGLLRCKPFEGTPRRKGRSPGEKSLVEPPRRGDWPLRLGLSCATLGRCP